MITRRDFIKLAGVGVLTIPFLRRKKKNNMTIQIDGVNISDYSVGLSTYEFDCTVRDIPYPGLVVSVAIFGTESVTSVVWQGLNLAPACVAVINGNYRIEIWYLHNAPIAEDVLQVNFSGSTTSISGAAAYQYFGGVGSHRGLASTDDLARVDFEDQSGTLIKDNSIILAAMCTSATSGVIHGHDEQNERWNAPNAAGTFIGSDRGPISPPVDPFSMSFLNPSALDVFAMSAVELLDYQSNPPEIMGSAM